MRQEASIVLELVRTELLVDDLPHNLIGSHDIRFPLLLIKAALLKCNVLAVVGVQYSKGIFAREKLVI